MAEERGQGGRSTSLGDTPLDDPRWDFIMRLVSEGAISVDDAKDVVRWTNPDDDLKAVAGMVAGEHGVSTRVIASALVGTPWEMSHLEIEERGRGWETYVDEFIEDYATPAAGIFEGYLRWGDRALMGLAKSGYSAVWGEEGYYGDAAEEDRRNRTAVQGEARREIERLHEMGYISAKKAKELKNLTGDYGDKEYRALYSEFSDIYREMDDIDREEALIHNSVLNALKQRMDPDAAPEPVEASEDMAAPSTQVLGAEGPVPHRPMTQTEIDLVTESGGLSFYADAMSSGVPVVGGPEEIEPPEERPRATYFGDEVIYDPSTGQSYSIEEWNLIKTNDNYRAKYEASKRVSPGVQEILNRPEFATQAHTWRDINYRDADGNWQTKRIPTGGVLGPNIGGPIQIPIEDLGIASPSPTNPWETSSFDFRAGDGRAQWMSFTPRERQMRLKMMRDEGLLSDEEIGAMQGAVTRDHISGGSPLNLTAMAIWEEAVGLSSDTNYTPIQALRAIGEGNRVVQAQQPRTGSGYARSAPKYSVPASLRTIPDYKSLAQESKGIFRNSVGRDLEDWELTILADEMKENYEHQNEQMIVAHKAAWDDAVAGGSTEVDFSEVTNPTAALEYDIEERYANELDRQTRVEDAAANRNVLMNSITVGQRMI